MITLTLFVSNHCSGCHPMIEKCKEIVDKNYDLDLEVYNIDDSDEAMSLAKSFYVMSTPTLLFRVNDIAVDELVGNVSTRTIEMKLEELK